jgi:hypothetical protein
MTVNAELTGLVPFIWERAAAFAAEKRNGEGLLAAYQFELAANLDLIDAVNIGALKDTDISGSDFRGLVENLHNEVGASILFSPDRAHYRRFLRHLKKHFRGGTWTPENEDDGGNGKKPETLDSVLKVLSFTVRKIEVLKRLARFAEPESPLFPRYRLAVRIRNIRDSLGALNGLVREMRKG